MCVPSVRVYTENPHLLSTMISIYLSMQIEHLFCTASAEQFEVKCTFQFDETPVDKRTMGRQSSCLYNFAIEWDARVNETNASEDQTLWRHQSNSPQFANQVENIRLYCYVAK